jgi:tRNA pseudouridine38-40 synthase
VRTLRLTLEYDGSQYVGWQRQAEGVSIQGLLEEALAPFERSAVTVHGAGRTDAGVHALGQVASVRVTAPHDVGTLQRALNAVLPLDVRVVDLREAAPDFHARFDATGKTYEYRIVNAPYVPAFSHRYAWHVPGRLDRAAMREGAAALVGRHDFAAFQASGGDVATTVRTITEIAIDESPAAGLDDGSLVLRVSGDGFLRHMVRTIAGTLVDVGLGRWPASHVAAIRDRRDRAAAGRAAPPHGLFLVRVHYDEGPRS